MLDKYISLSTEVEEALAAGRPIVALESTLIAHGFPYPKNLKLAEEMEDYLRKEGVVPATVAILDGKIKVGLTAEELKRIATEDNVQKASLRDLSILPVLGKTGATTVAGTMQVADLLGIKVFVTGGIGGVHYHGEETLDISADLEALSRFNLIVVSAGAKSVLDLARTRERLETLGVPVLGYQTDSFPAFYLRDSGLNADYRVDQIKEVVDILNFHEEFSSGAILLTVPIPEEDELNSEEFNELLKELLSEVEEKGIKGKEVTPYLLAELGERTAGESIKANIALIKNNLKVGCQIAQEYYRES